MKSIFSAFRRPVQVKTVKLSPKLRTSEERKQASSTSPSDPGERFSFKDWDKEFRKAQELLEELEKEDGLRDLLGEARVHIESARQARDLKMDAQVAHELGALEKIRRRMGSTLYLSKLADLGISPREIAKSDMLQNADTWKIILSSIQGILLAICADVARKDFPHLEVRVVVERVVSSSRWGIVPVISVGDRLFSVGTDYLKDFAVEIQKEEKEHFLVVKHPMGGAMYTFSQEDIRPFAFSQKKSKERFVIPSIIEKAWREGHPEGLSSYIFSLVASFFGLTEAVCTHAEMLIKREIRDSLRNQGVSGEFLSEEDQKKLGSPTPLLPILRRKGVILDRELLNWFHRFTTLPADSGAPDISFESLDENLLFCAGITETTLFRQKYYARDGYEKMKEEKKYEISFYLLIGPWMFKISSLPFGDNQRKELVETLPHSLKREKVKEPYESGYPGYRSHR